YTKLRKVSRNTAEAVNTPITTALTPLKHLVHTITYDNGKEFSAHLQVAQQLQADTFFATPYHSWERGLNENTNGLVRQYFPKKHDFARITNAEVQRAEDRLNNRPRKTLGYRTPNEVFFKERFVALPT